MSVRLSVEPTQITGLLLVALGLLRRGLSRCLRLLLWCSRVFASAIGHDWTPWLSRTLSAERPLPSGSVFRISRIGYFRPCHRIKTPLSEGSGLVLKYKSEAGPSSDCRQASRDDPRLRVAHRPKAVLCRTGGALWISAGHDRVACVSIRLQHDAGHDRQTLRRVRVQPDGPRSI